VLVNNEEEYEAEEILDSRFVRSALKYLVRWKGYPISEATWEPTKHLKNSPSLVQQFHTKYPAKPSPK
jgi:Chromo (CHRromatin Organisation MOdifier) domain